MLFHPSWLYVNWLDSWRQATTKKCKHACLHCIASKWRRTTARQSSSVYERGMPPASWNLTPICVLHDVSTSRYVTIGFRGKRVLLASSASVPLGGTKGAPGVCPSSRLLLSLPYRCLIALVYRSNSSPLTRCDGGEPGCETCYSFTPYRRDGPV